MSSTAVNGTHAAETKRTYHTVDGAHYSLPNDALEHQRLEDQAPLLQHLVGGYLVHAPLSTPPNRILDVGCGTGIVTATLASQYPSAEAIGLDLTPVPNIPGRQLPPNVSFLQGNVLDLQGKDAVTKGGFDLIYSRLLLAGMSDWPKYIQTSASLLTPGTGWLEIHDLDWVWYDSDSNVISESWPWLRVLDSECEKRGLSLTCGSQAEKWMREAGLVDIRQEVFVWKFEDPGPESDEIQKRFLRYTQSEMPGLVFGFLTKLAEGKGYSEDEVAGWRNLIEDIKPGKGKHWKFYVTYGRRP